MVPTLKTLCGDCVVITFSNLPQVKRQIFSFSSFSSLSNLSTYKEWKGSLLQVVEKELKISSTFMRGGIPCHLFPLIGLEMIKCAKMLESQFKLDFKFTENFISSTIFGSNLAIEDCKAARELVKDCSLSLSLRFRIACCYLLEDIIPELYLKLRDVPEFYQEISSCNIKNAMKLCSQCPNDEYELLASNIVSDKREFFCGKALPYAFTNFDLMNFYFTPNLVSIITDEVDKEFLFSRCLNHISEFFNKTNFSSPDFILSWRLKNYINLSILLLELFEKKTIPTPILWNTGLNFYKCLLLWPFQDLFIKFSLSHLNLGKYYQLLLFIADLIDDEVLGESYNYILLLREFYVKILRPCEDLHNIRSRIATSVSNLMKNPNISYDRGVNRITIAKLFLILEFAPDDQSNFLLILKSAYSQQKDCTVNSNQLMFVNIVFDLLSAGKFKFMNLYIDNLILNYSNRRELKEIIALDSVVRVVTITKNFDLAYQIVNWATDPEGIENLKTKIFTLSFKHDKVAELYIGCKFSFTNLDELLKWFLHTNDKILEWKKEAVFGEEFCECFVFSEKKDRNSFEMFLNWLGHPSDKVTTIKQQILGKAFHKILKILFKGTLLTSCKENILYLCSYNKNLLEKFIDDINAWCNRHCEGNSRLSCVENEPFNSGPEESELHSNSHGSFNIISKKRIDNVMRSFPVSLNLLLLMDELEKKLLSSS